MRHARAFGLALALAAWGVAGWSWGESAAAATPPSGELTVTAIYEARLLVKLADLRTDQVVGPERYKAGARLATIGALGFIKPSILLDQSDGVVRGGVPMPERFIQTEKNGTKHRTVRFNGGAGWKSLADPLAQLLRAALQPGGGSPCVGAVPVYDGRQRYELILSPAGGGRLEGAATRYGLTRPLTCRLGFHPISGFSQGPAKSNPFLRGDPVATFAYAPGQDVWVMTDVAIPTVAGSGHIALVNLALGGRRPVFSPAPVHGQSRRHR